MEFPRMKLCFKVPFRKTHAFHDLLPCINCLRLLKPSQITVEKCISWIRTGRKKSKLLIFKEWYYLALKQRHYDRDTWQPESPALEQRWW